jgi:DNA-binding CsgD family transcriptional regulator
MKARCLDPNNPRYPDYGGRGITITDRWLGERGFKNFLSDMGPRPEGKTLDRYPNNDGNYEPSNCQWRTPKQQNNNQRDRLRHIDFEAVKALYSQGKPTVEIAKQFHVTGNTIAARLRKAGIEIRPAVYYRTGMSNCNARPDVSVQVVRNLRARGMSVREIALRLQASTPTIYDRLEAA